MLQAIQPPAAILPMRNGSVSFSADSAPEYDPSIKVTPSIPDSGRQNNQGFEGLTTSNDGKTLYALLQSAMTQEGGQASSDSGLNHARMLEYDVSVPTPVLKHEYVVELPTYTGLSKKGKAKTKTAKQSEIHFLSETQFLVMSRDRGSGHGTANTESVYRHADIFDISTATDINNAKYNAAGAAIASSEGVLNSDVNAAQYCSFLDFNVNAELQRFGVHNGGASDQGLLNEKWESLATAPVNPGQKDGKYFLFSLSDNDFITQNGSLSFGTFPYQDASGYNLDSQALVFEIEVPQGVHPGGTKTEKREVEQRACTLAGSCKSAGRRPKNAFLGL
jgi:hypothetical protein